MAPADSVLFGPVMAPQSVAAGLQPAIVILQTVVSTALVFAVGKFVQKVNTLVERVNVLEQTVGVGVNGLRRSMRSLGRQIDNVSDHVRGTKR